MRSPPLAERGIARRAAYLRDGLSTLKGLPALIRLSFLTEYGYQARYPSRTSKSWVILAVWLSILVAEQYFSAESWIARSTFFGSSALPVTVKWMWILVKTLGSA